MVSNTTYYAIGIWSGSTNVASLIFNATATKILYDIERTSKTPVTLTLLFLCIDNIVQCIAHQIFVTPVCFGKQWFWGDNACTFYAFLTYWLALTSIYHMVLLSWQHYTILTSKSIQERRADYCSRIMPSIHCALLSLFWCILPLLGWSSYGLEGLYLSCSLKWDVPDISHITYNISATITSFFFPIAIMAALYIRLFFFIKRNSLKPDSATKRSKRHAEYLLMRLGVILTVSFFCIWAPYAIVCFVTMVNPTMMSPLTKTIPSLFAKGSTLTLPIVFLFIHKEYKKRLRETFRFKFRVKASAVQLPMLNDINKTEQGTETDERLLVNEAMSEKT
ncbi:melanopsin-A-like [Rhopilema esculentum]|uniref:melanopsin-A-like n=1 Tax=Rhopilema esculentum TaxID=499914 RepID=UPI0031D49B30|eukprot:gene14004-4973_t